MKKFHFWHDFIPLSPGLDIITFLKRKYLAYCALLAGWIWFCYWLLTHGIWPTLNNVKTDAFPVRMDSLQLPLAFSWGSDIPLAGKGFDAWKEQFRKIDSTGAILIWDGYYFKDEADTPEAQIDLGLRRIKKVVSFLALDPKRMLVQSLPQEINADVKSNPFSAIGFEKYTEDEILSYHGDTAQICFPIADSLLLPAISLEKLDEWSQEQSGKNREEMYLIGTADGTGIAESSDVAVDRAVMIKDRWIKAGWKQEFIHLSTGQRNTPNTLQNRCVIIYFEQDAKQ
jgi:hypothetical protein